VVIKWDLSDCRDTPQRCLRLGSHVIDASSDEDRSPSIAQNRGSAVDIRHVYTVRLVSILQVASKVKRMRSQLGGKADWIGRREPSRVVDSNHSGRLTQSLEI